MKNRTSAAAGAAVAGAFLGLLWLERRRPLRRRTAPQAPRMARNLATGAIAGAVVASLEAPLTQALAALAQRRRLGVVPRLGLPPALEPAMALLLLDYTLYLWHVLLHRSPALWRWHRVHHGDPDLDVSTALRFHAMELLWSIPWRAAQVVLIGVPPRTLRLWGQLTLVEVMFHHSNLRLPARLEQLLQRLVVTPAQHGLHHADDPALQEANFSSGLAMWDVLHGTISPQVPQGQIAIGLPAQQPAP